ERWTGTFFPLIATIFLFVLTNAWLSLFPGFGTIGLVHHGEHGMPFQGSGLEIVPFNTPSVEAGHAAPAGIHAGSLASFLRGANTDLNTTLALALIAVFFIEMWGVRAHG